MYSFSTVNYWIHLIENGIIRRLFDMAFFSFDFVHNPSQSSRSKLKMHVDTTYMFFHEALEGLFLLHSRYEKEVIVHMTYDIELQDSNSCAPKKIFVVAEATLKSFSKNTPLRKKDKSSLNFDCLTLQINLFRINSKSFIRQSTN